MEFHRTLGLRSWPGSGALKPAYETLLCELRDRGFCATTCTASVPDGTDVAEPDYQLVVDPIAGTVRVITAPGPSRPVRVHAADGRVVARGRTGESVALGAGAMGVLLLEVEGLGVRRFVLN